MAAQQLEDTFRIVQIKLERLVLYRNNSYGLRFGA